MKSFALRPAVALLTFIIGVSIASSGLLRPNVPRAIGDPALPQNQEPQSASVLAWRILLSFENRDFAGLEQESENKLKRAIRALVGPGDSWPLIPRLFTKMPNAEGRISYVLIEESPAVVIPGETGLSVHVFSPEGRILSSSAFSSGWRIFLTGMKVKYMPEVGREVLEVSSQPSLNGRDVAKEYYALIGEKLLLVRLEDSAGRLIRNYYGAPNHTFGPTITGRTAAEWELALESLDEAEVLAALVWVGGEHWDPREHSPDYKHEEMSEARLADEVRSLDGVKARLGELVRSENAWVRGAAESAAEVEYYGGGIIFIPAPSAPPARANNSPGRRGRGGAFSR